ncbi:hypothetical protein [Xanthomonas populi]|nr:hypothetical protein [Xanthomonas populi]
MEWTTIGWKTLLAVCFFSSTGLAWSKSPEPPPAFQEVIAQTGAENSLRFLLGDHFEKFKGNFTEAANPVRLKDGGIFLDGWREGGADSHAAAFVFYPDGRVYAAYYDREEGQVRYFGNKSARIHPAIEIWAKRFAPPFKVLSQNDSQRSSQTGTVAAASSPTPAEQEEMRKVAAAIWNPSLAARWDMNAEVGDILGAVTKEIMDCSEAFNLVPKPVGWIPGWAYVAKTAIQITAYLAGLTKDRVYRTCVSAAALNWRSRIEMASAGI